MSAVVLELNGNTPTRAVAVPAALSVGLVLRRRSLPKGSQEVPLEHVLQPRPAALRAQVRRRLLLELQRAPLQVPSLVV